MPWPKTGKTHYHEQLSVPDRGHANRVVCRKFTCLLKLFGIFTLERVIGPI